MDRLEAEIAAKAKTGRASSALRKGNSNSSSNRNKLDALAKKLHKEKAASGTPPTIVDAGSSKRRTGAVNAAVGDAKTKKKKKGSIVEGMGGATFAGADAKKHNGEKTYRTMDGGRHGGGNGFSATVALQGGNHEYDDDFADENYDETNRLAVAVAVDEDENVFIPSAVEYDPDAKVPVYKNQRFRVYGLLTCTLLIIIAACSVTVLTVLEKNQQADDDWPPTESPTCTRCTVDFIEQIELEVGSQKLRDPSSPEYMAKEWLIHEDEMELLPTHKDFIQRYLLAAFYFDTHQIAEWRSCNRQSIDPSKNETEQCTLLKVSGVEPLEFQGCKRSLRVLSL
jgi:hypothetical protein